jgi:hypothetical protein
MSLMKVSTILPGDEGDPADPITVYAPVMPDRCVAQMIIEVTSNEKQYEDAATRACNSPENQSSVAAAFFISFVIITSMILMTLFMGAVSMSMTSAMLSIKEEKSQARLKKLEHLTQYNLEVRFRALFPSLPSSVF